MSVGLLGAVERVHRLLHLPLLLLPVPHTLAPTLLPNAYGHTDLVANVAATALSDAAVVQVGAAHLLGRTT